MTTLQKLEEAAKAVDPRAWNDMQNEMESDGYRPSVVAHVIETNPATILALCERERQRDALLGELVSALEAALQFVHEGVDRGPCSSGWKGTMELVGEVLAKSASFTSKDASL